MFNETLFSRCLSHRGLLIFNEIGPGEADVAGRAKTGTSVESSLGLTSKDNLPETSYSIQNMKPLGLNATFEGSAMSVYQEDDPEEEEIGDGLLHSLGGGLEAYDNAIQNFQARLQRGQPNKSPKIGWTFWFLLKSVVLPSMIPILIAGPLVFIFFRMEQLYFQGKLPFSLVIFWVTAWVFTLDLMYLCHWFTYEDIPIDPNQPILADDQFIDGQVSSDDNMLPPKIDIEQGPLSSSSGSILNAPDTKRTSPRATLQPGSSVFNMARRASSMMISPQMGGMMGMGAQMGGMLGVGTQVTGMLGVGSQMGMSGGGCRSSIMPGLYPPQMMQMRPSLVPGDPVSQRSTGGGSAKARASILNKRKDIAEPTRAIESPNAALTSPNEALETLEEDDSNSSAGSLPVVAMNFPGDQGSQSSLTKSSASEASDAYEPPPNFRLPPTTEEEDEEHDQFDVSASPGAFTFTAIATPVIEEKGLELNEISITVDEGDNDNKKWSLEKVSTPAEIPKMQSKPAVSAPTGFLSTGLTDGVRRLSRAVFGSPAASEQRLSFALSISPSIAPSMATSEAPSDPDKSRPLRRKSTRKSVFPVFQPGRRVSRAIVYNPNDAYGMAQMFSNASRRISVRSDDSADAGSSTLSVNEKHIVIAEKEDVKFSAFDPFDNSTVRDSHHVKIADSDAGSLSSADGRKINNLPSDVKQDASEEEDIEYQRIWSPLLFFMMAKFVIRWLAIPLFLFFAVLTDVIFLCAYPFLVVPGAIFAHMLIVTRRIYPFLARFITSFIVVFCTEVLKQLVFYSMILPLAFMDVISDSPIGGILKAVLFFVSRNLVKFITIFSDRRAVQEQRKAQLAEKKEKAEKEQAEMKKKQKSDGEDDAETSTIKMESSTRNEESVEIVYEDEIMDLSYYGQLILALGGHGVPGWVFILRIENPTQFWIAGSGSLLLDAGVAFSIKKYQDWFEKRKQKGAKLVKKKENQLAQLGASSWTKSSHALASRRGSIVPQSFSKSKKEPQKKLKHGAMNAKNKGTGNKTLNQKDTSYLSSRLMDTRTGNSGFARTRAMSLTPVNANELYDITSRTNALSKSALQLDKGAMESFNQKTRAAINAFAVSALHQDNRRIAVEKRFDMCSTYSSIIGAAVVYLISLSDDPKQALCSTYGVVSWDTILWRASFILAGQFLVDWWFTTNQIAWGLPFAFTTQIHVTFVQGFMVASFAIAQSVTVLMAHERGLFGFCVPNKPAG